MPASLTSEEYGDGIGTACTVLRENAARAGLRAAVPTCPGWTVRDLVAHLGMVHRWATAIVLGEEPRDLDLVEQQGRDAGDPMGWLDEGARGLLAALAFAPEDLEAFFFLKDAPAPRLAWARRQCHETTVHAVDAMSASRGQAPSAAETWIAPASAVDGVDELLCGFVPRRKAALRSPEPRTVVVEASDTGHGWRLEIGEGPVVTTARGPGERPWPVAADATTTLLTGTAAQLYLGLWNRGEEVQSRGPEFLSGWRHNMTVTWD